MEFIFSSGQKQFVSFKSSPGCYSSFDAYVYKTLFYKKPCTKFAEGRIPSSFKFICYAVSLFSKWVVTSGNKWQIKEVQQLQNLRATSFRVARSLIQFSNSECDLQKFLLLILLLQSECPAVPESLPSSGCVAVTAAPELSSAFQPRTSP